MEHREERRFSRLGEDSCFIVNLPIQIERRAQG
jgi:hypothetical protein